jgi:hypothetical protein
MNVSPEMSQENQLDAIQIICDTFWHISYRTPTLVKLLFSLILKPNLLESIK